jgi:hypothetical protein
MKTQKRPGIITTMPLELWIQLKPLMQQLANAGEGAAIMMQPFRDGIRAMIVSPEETSKIHRIISPDQPATLTSSVRDDQS